MSDGKFYVDRVDLKDEQLVVRLQRSSNATQTPCFERVVELVPERLGAQKTRAVQLVRLALAQGWEPTEEGVWSHPGQRLRRASWEHVMIVCLDAAIQRFEDES